MKTKKKNHRFTVFGTIIFLVVVVFVSQQRLGTQSNNAKLNPGKSRPSNIIISMPDAGIILWSSLIGAISDIPGAGLVNSILSIGDLSIAHPVSSPSNIVLSMPDAGFTSPGSDKSFSSADSELFNCLSTHLPKTDPAGASTCLAQYQEAISGTCKTISTMFQDLLRSGAQ